MIEKIADVLMWGLVVAIVMFGAFCVVRFLSRPSVTKIDRVPPIDRKTMKKLARSLSKDRRDMMVGE